MGLINNMKIGLRLNIILSSAMVIIISILGIYILNKEHSKIIADTDLRMHEQVDNLVSLVEHQISQNQKVVNLSLTVANQVINNRGDIEVNSEKFISYNAVNQVTKDAHSIKVKAWNINDMPIQNNYEIVDDVQKLVGGTSTIFQKIPQGFLRISTNVMKENGERAIGTYIPNDSPVAKAVNSGNVYKGRAFVVNDWYLTAYQPIIINGNIEGIIFVGVKEKNIPAIKEVFQKKKYFDSGYPFMVDKSGTFIIHPKKEGENFYDAEFFQQLVNSKENYGKTYYMWEGKQKFQYFKYIESIEAYVSVSIYEHELMGIINEFRFVLLVAIVLGIIVFVSVNTLISRSISNSLNRAVKLAELIAHGDLSEDLEIYQKDEVGQLADALNKMVAKLRNIVSGIMDGADSIASSSEQLSQNSIRISQGATEQASSVEEISATMEEISSNIEQNNDNAKQTKQNSQMALDKIEGISSKSIQALEAQNKITDKIQIITEIAFQTNILALNAAVEAARAGQYGKGFAVVAAEVRKLAENSKVSADEIVLLAESSSALAEETGNGMKEVLPSVQKTTSLVHEISVASQEQTNGVNQVNNAIVELNDVTQQNASSSEEMASNSEELSAQAIHLKEMISFFSVIKRKN